MKILFASPGFGDPSENIQSALGYNLQQRGHDIDAFCFAVSPQIKGVNTKTKWTFRSIDQYVTKKITERHPWVTANGRWIFNWLLYHRWKRAVSNELQATDYDIVLTTQITISPTVLAASEQGVPSVIITTGPATVKYDPNDRDTDKTPDFASLPIGKKIQYPFIRAVHQWNYKAFTEATEVFATSEFDASITSDTFGREPKLIYIPVPIDKFKTDAESGSNITLVNPRDSNKGLDTFLEIAEQLPDQEFLIAGSLYDDSLKSAIEKISNITYLGWCDDMSEVYAKTKLLLVPSTYQEGGPRVIIEAFSNGIPAIGSNIGGIPDYIGDGGDVVDNYTDPEAWVTIVTQYLSDNEYYKQKSQTARRRSELFDQELIVDEFEKILTTAVNEN